MRSNVAALPASMHQTPFRKIEHPASRRKARTGRIEAERAASLERAHQRLFELFDEAVRLAEGIDNRPLATLAMAGAMVAALPILPRKKSR